MLTPSRRALVEKCPFYYPFGNTVVRNVLKDCQFASNNVKVLFLGSGDLRNALKTAGNRKNLENLHIHLNDLNPSVVARNILILKIISADSFDISNEEDTSFLWDIWYNAEWPEATRRRFESVLKELLDNNLPDNVAIPKSCYLRTLRTVWSAWMSSITSQSKSESDLFMKKIRKERKSIMFNGWFRMHKIEVDPNESPSSFFPKIVDGFAGYLAAAFKDFDSSLKQKIHKEARQYFSTGSCRLKIGVDNVCVNPTMIDPSTSRWNVHYQLCPFDGYIPLNLEELDRSDDGGILIRTCQKILKNLVADFKKRIDGIKIFFHLEDALEFCLSENTLSFDVIDCSNLADHIGLVHLINACEKILTDTPEAIFFTETLTWKRAAPTALQYIEETLCCSLSMIPSIYGLILTNHVELGSSIPTNNSLGNKIPPIMLCWKKAPTFKNVKLSPSPELSRCLNQLAQRCFLPHNLENYNYSKNIITTGARMTYCETLCFTPLTFSYIVNSMIGRVEGDPLCFRADPAEIPSVYNLSRRTLEAWKNNEIPLKLSSTLQSNEIPAGKINEGFQSTPAMRLVLAPHQKFIDKYLEAICRQQFEPLTVFPYELSDPDIHIIDNFQFEVKQTADGEIQTSTISFLLVSDHGLEKTHCAYVFNVTNSVKPIFLFEPVSSMQVEEYRQPYPFSPKRPQVPAVVPKQSNMRVDSCIESVDNYTLQIAIECRKNISGLKVSPNQCLPCESVHGLTLSLSQPNDIEPLALNFPFPILAKDICATLHRQNRSIDLVLKKALYEPWPYEFQAKQSRWNVDNLKPWKDGSRVELDLTTHLNTQFKMNLLRSYLYQGGEKYFSLTKLPALTEIQGTIKSLMLNNREFVCIRRKDLPRSPDWYLRVHLPVRISPLGSPILLLSALDHRLVGNLTFQGKIDHEEALNDFTRIFEAPRFQKYPDGVLTTIWTYTAEEEQLLRYVLRLNSTKIMPSIWQKKNLPKGKYNLWLATFVSPLYDDCPVDQESFDTVQMQEEIKSYQTSCAACRKSSQNLKRCSRCRVILYCSVECQRGHWTQHKNACNYSGK